MSVFGEQKRPSASNATAEENADGADTADTAEDAAEEGPAEGGDARLRAAVAAWVAADEPDEADEPVDTDSEPSADADTDTDTEADTEVDTEADTDTEDGSEEKADGSAAPDSAPKDADDEKTAMFRKVRRQPEDGESAAQRAERMTTAFFGTVREESGDSGASEGTGEPEQSGEPDADADAGTDAGTDADAGAGAQDGPATDEAPKESEEPATEGAKTDEATTALRVGGPRKRTVDQPTTAIRLPKGAAASEAAEEPGTPRAKPEPAEAKPEPAEAKPATTEAKPEPTEETAEDEPESAEQPEPARESRFVPLKSLDEPPRPARPPVPPKPPAAPAAQPLPPAVGAPRTPGDSKADSELPSLGERERTRQQPLPEPPPLDLLAQLTNKPPPPETPLRTAVRRVKIWTPLIVLLGIIFVVAQSVRPLPESELSLTAASSFSFEGSKPSLPMPSEGQAYIEVSGLGVLGKKGEQKPVPIGSVAKTMTAYLTLRKAPLEVNEDGPSITVDKKAEEGGKRGAGNGGESVLDTVEAGDKLTEREALSALMIPSANNIARLLARWHSDGSEKAFVEEMNETAEELGMENTTYTDPSGLKESTVSTAADQVKLAKKVMEIPALVAITKLPEWTDPSGKTWRNYNTLVPFNGAIGIKTGSTTAAGGNLLFAGHEDIGGTRQLIVGAVLGQHAPPIIDTVNAVSKGLLIAAGEALDAHQVVRKGQVVGYVDDRLGGRTPVVATKDVTAVGWPGLTVELGMEPGAEPVPHEAKKGERVGVLTVGEGPGQVKVPVALQENLAEPAFGDRLTRIL